MKILVLHASFGSGHKKAALAVSQFLQAPCKDLLDFSPSWIKKAYAHSYLFVSEYLPFLWQLIFLVAKNRLARFFLETIHRFIFSLYFTYLREHKPRIVITTHFYPIFLTALVKKELNLKLVSVVTDLRVHPLWVNDKVDRYIVTLKDTKDDLIKFGIPEEKITAGFVPLREGFLNDVSDSVMRKKLHLDLRPCLLFVSSLRGKFPFLKEVIGQLKDNFNIIVIYGKNTKIKRYLEKIGYPSIKTFGFYEDFWEIVSLASVIISKPGGLTIFEGVYKKKPFIFSHYIPGQERQNMDVLLRYGAARFTRDKKELLDNVAYFLSEEVRIKNNYPIEIQDIRKILPHIIDRLSTNGKS